MPEISIVIPVYRGEASLVPLYERLTAVLKKTGDSFEIIFVEDCGGDESWSLIRQIAASDPRVTGIKLSRNFGQHNALLAGIRAAKGDIIVTMDDDLQNPPEEIPALLAALGEDMDVVYGTPNREQHGLLRDLASRFTKLAMQKSIGMTTAPDIGAFRAFRTHLRDAFADYRSPSVSIDVLLTWGTGRFTAIPVRHDMRAAGTSAYTLAKLVRHAFNIATGFSTIPLTLATIIGLVFSVLGFVILGYVVAKYLVVGTSVPGFPFLASIIAIFSGVQLFALGIIGEYIARIHMRTMDKPAYAIEQTTGSNEPSLRLATKSPDSWEPAKSE